MISVVVITYNHEKYIQQTIEGILNQNCNYAIELIIANDNSTDNTHKIIGDIIAQNDTKLQIKYFNHQTNKGAINNFVWAISRANSKYIALCEGDDYWTDPYKLQKQVDFLEVNSEYSMVFHKANVLYSGKVSEDLTIEKRYNKINDKENITTLDLLLNGNFIHTCSVLFRREQLNLPKEINFSPVGDYLLFIALSQQGKIKRIDESMAVYRKGTGTYSSLPPADMQRKILEYHLCILSFLKEENERLTFLKKSLNEVNNFEKQLSGINNLASTKSMSDIIKIIIKKLISLAKKN